jgi:hypothetical protein
MVADIEKKFTNKLKLNPSKDLTPKSYGCLEKMEIQ